MKQYSVRNANKPQINNICNIFMCMFIINNQLNSPLGLDFCMFIIDHNPLYII